MWTFRALATSAALVLAVVATGASPAQAIARYSALAVANDASHAVGDKWQEILPDGEAMTVQKIAPGVSMSRTAVRLSLAQCSGNTYLCAWSNDDATGSFWRYNMDNVYSNTANGVAHCWNLAADANNNQSSWYNTSRRQAQIGNWVNCNIGGGSFNVGAFGAGDDHVSCWQLSDDWCSNLRATSIKAYA